MVMGFKRIGRNIGKFFTKKRSKSPKNSPNRTNSMRRTHTSDMYFPTVPTHTPIRFPTAPTMSPKITMEALENDIKKETIKASRIYLKNIHKLGYDTNPQELPELARMNLHLRVKLNKTANKYDEQYISALERIQSKYGSHHGGKTTRKRRMTRKTKKKR
jgi:hypothetical protein